MASRLGAPHVKLNENHLCRAPAGAYRGRRYCCSYRYRYLSALASPSGAIGCGRREWRPEAAAAATIYVALFRNSNTSFLWMLYQPAGAVAPYRDSDNPLQPFAPSSPGRCGAQTRADWGLLPSPASVPDTSLVCLRTRLTAGGTALARSQDDTAREMNPSFRRRRARRLGRARRL